VMSANHITDSEQKVSNFVKVVPEAKHYAMIARKGKEIGRAHV
jgi:hypothetical protein